MVKGGNLAPITLHKNNVRDNGKTLSSPINIMYIKPYIYIALRASKRFTPLLYSFKRSKIITMKEALSF
jgi:hypothetical protein